MQVLQTQIFFEVWTKNIQIWLLRKVQNALFGRETLHGDKEMTAKAIMDFIEKYAHEPDMFGNLEQDLTNEKYDILVEIEHNYENKKLNRKYQDICEKLRMIQLMRMQRLELFMQAKI